MARGKTTAVADVPPKQQKPIFSSRCKFGGTSFGAETVAVGVTFNAEDIPEKYRPMFIKQQLKVRVSMDPNPSDQPMLAGMEDPYDFVVGVSTFGKISVGDSDVSTRLKFPINAIDSMFMVGLACQQGSLHVLEIMGGSEGADVEEAEADELEE